MIVRSRRVLLVLGPTLALLCFGGDPAHAEAPSFLRRARDTVGGFVRRIAEIFVPPSGTVDDLERLLDTYAKGHPFTTWLGAVRLSERSPAWLQDETELLAGLAAADAGIAEEAVPRLEAVLDAEPVSPYYAVALAALLEVQRELSSPEDAAATASRYLGSFWGRPRTAREAEVLALFHETAHVVEERETDKGGLPGATDRKILRRAERPADQALYLAGSALLRGGRFEEAARCLSALRPSSPFYVYARYGLAQASYALQRYRAAQEALGDILEAAGEAPGELYLRDRASLLGAQISNELGDSSAAIRWLRQVSPQSPFGLHAALLAAEIHGQRAEPALALAYLGDRADETADPKVAARAAAAAARFRRALEDPSSAVGRLEEGLRVLDRYEGQLRRVLEDPARARALLEPLERQQESRELLAAWRRQDLAAGIPQFLRGRAGVGWGTRVLADLLGGSSSEGRPVAYYRRSVDPFAALPPPRELPVEPAPDPAFPSVFRRSWGSAVGEALHHEIRLRNAMRDGDPVEIAVSILDGELALRDFSPRGAVEPPGDRIGPLRVPNEVAEKIREGGPRSRILLEATRALEAEPPGAEAVRAAAADHFERWREHQQELLRRAVREELKAVQELRFELDLELSQTLAARGPAGRVPSSPAPPRARGAPPAG
jgi:hypothetical protein